MRHRLKGKLLDREKQPRELMLRNLAASVLLYEHVTTTVARGKAVRTLVEKAIALGKDNSVQTRRHLLELLPVRSAVQKVLEDIGPRYRERHGGYTRITKLARRRGDNAEMVVIELV